MECNPHDLEYFRLLNLVINQGRVKKNRTGIDTQGIFGAQARFDLSAGLPVLTTKKIFTKAVIHELLWFIKGDTNIKYLVDNGVHIWDEWAYTRFQERLNKENSYGCDYADTEGTPLTQEQFVQAIKNSNDQTRFAERWGDLGQGTYGQMWRAFPYHESKYIDPQVDFVDQLQRVIDKLKNNPDDRRMIVSAWHPYWVDHCALPPCHCLFQFYTEELTAEERFDLWVKNPNNNPYEVRPAIWNDACVHIDADKLNIPRRRLNCQLYQRSCDLFLGVPFNILSYSLLTHMMAHCVGMAPGTFVHTYGDLHIYTNHMEQVREQLSRTSFPAPTLWLNPDVKDLFKFKYEDFRIEGYQSHPTIKAEVAV